jgi:hypothetical protein
MQHMAGLMRHGPDHLQRRVGPHQQACIDEHAVAGRDERVYGTVAHDEDACRVGVQARGAIKGNREVMQQRLGFGVAYQHQPFGWGFVARPGGLDRQQQTQGAHGKR